MKDRTEIIVKILLSLVFTICVLLLIFLCLITGGCSKRIRDPTVQYVPIETISNTRIIHTERVDTVLIEVPAQSAERTTVDSVSHLETDYAESNAKINEDGTLSHSLKNKVGKIPAPVVIPNDTVYIENNIEVPIPVEVIKEVPRTRSWWELCLMYFGGLSLILIGYAIYRKFRK